MRGGYIEDRRTTQLARDNEYAPPARPRSRPRALTDPRPEEAITLSWWRHYLWSGYEAPQQRTLDQAQCPLLTRLPPEIQQLIFAQVLGHRVLHIIPTPGKLLAVECTETLSRSRETRQHGCWGLRPAKIAGSTEPDWYHGPLPNHPSMPARLLPLLQTCRRIYAQAITLLYATNLFDMSHLDTVRYFQRSVIPTRLQQIRRLNLTWEFRFTVTAISPPYDLQTWCEACAVLAELQLQELTVHLDGPFDLAHGLQNRDRWGPLLEALATITASDRFEVFLPWLHEECVEAAIASHYPFRLMPKNGDPDSVSLSAR